MKFSTYCLLIFTMLFSVEASAATFTVTTQTGNTGTPAAGSFYWAIDQANATAGADIIEFNIPVGSTITCQNWIQKSLTEEVFIDGYNLALSNAQITCTLLRLEIPLAVSNVTVKGLIFSATDHALDIKGSNNTVKSCTISATGWGQHAIWINSGSGNLVSKCTFPSSGGNSHAISIENGGGHTVDSCQISNIQDIGIIVRGTGSNTIKNTTIETGDKNGIGIENCDGNSIENCITKNNAWAGIAIVPTWGTTNYSDNNTVTNCQVFGNGENGIQIGGNGNTVQKSHVYNNCKAATVSAIVNDYHYAGINVIAGTNSVDSSYIYDNGGHGVLFNLANTSNSVVSKCIIGRSASGVESGNSWNGVFVRYGSDITVEESIIVNNGKAANSVVKVSGIRYQEATGGTIRNNYIGTDPARSISGNDFDGITLHTNVSNVTITGNFICNNGVSSSIAPAVGGGIALRISASNNTIQTNSVGFHANGSAGSNADYGVSIEQGSNSNIIGGTNIGEGNTIGNSTGNYPGGDADGVGIWITSSTSTQNEVYGNDIGNNNSAGILIENSASQNIIGQLNAGNVITSNTNGIEVRNNGGTGTNRNTLRFNSFSCNTVQGIALSDGGNNLFGKPGTVNEVTVKTTDPRVNFVSGTAPAGSTVDIYAADNTCTKLCDDTVRQGVTYVATVTALPAGTWEYDFVAGGNLVNKTNVIVHATETPATGGFENSSEFSVCVLGCSAPANVSISGTSGVCPGGNSVLTANSTGNDPLNNIHYEWYLGSVGPANIQKDVYNDNLHTVNTSGNYLVVITDTTDVSNCSTTSAPFTFTVNTNPTINVTAASASFCTGNSVQLSAGNSGNMSYAWTSPPSFTATTENITVTTGGKYDLTITDNATTCTNTGSVTVTENPNPVINLTTPSTNLCTGINLVLSSGNVSPNTVTWTPTNETTNNITVTSGGTYSVTATAPNTCTTTESATITEHIPPTPTVSDQFFCQGDAATLNATLPDVTYAWTPGNATTESITTTTEGTYTVIVTDTLTGCTGTTSAFADESPDPKPTIDAGENDTICFFKDEEAILTATYTSVTTPEFEWSNSLIDPTITVTDTIVYTVSIVDSLGCTGADTVEVVNYCIPPTRIVPNVFVPGGTNPSDNPIFTPVGTITPEDLLRSHFEVYDRWGLLMYETDGFPTWDGNFKGKPAASGVYFWIWNYDDVTQTHYDINGFVHLIRKN